LGLVLAFDTATHVATVAIVENGTSLGERTTRAQRVLLDADELLRAVGATPGDVDALAVGIGPGSFTGLRLGLAAALGFGLARGTPAAGVSTLAVLGVGAPGALPVIDAGRRQVFALVRGEPRALAADELRIEPGTMCVGDGAVRYRRELEEAGAEVPDDDSEVHIPHARLHVQLAGDSFRAVEELAPLYVREPDAKMRV
jgi:tRNA threonylcarbamoyladenosine biosynthesis protein TsaB